MEAYWSKPVADLFEELQTSRDGLTQADAGRRLALHGANVVADTRQSGTLVLLLRQYKSPLVLILIFAAVVSILVREWTDAIIILLIVMGSTLLGFLQEFHASRAVQELRKRLSLRTTVIRHGMSRQIETRLLVPGDIVELSAGNMVPADGIVLQARDFLVSQAALTGESFPVEKLAAASPEAASLTQRTNAVYLGTSVRSGTATVLVVRTGKSTELAGLAAGISGDIVEADFARGIRRFGYLLLRIMIVIVLSVLVINFLLHRPFIDSLLFAVALAVGLSPELLPAIMSVTLSAGARHMAQKGVLVRRLEAIEDLGNADVLCTDKTGTLTKGVVELSSAFDMLGHASDRVLRLATINSSLQTGIQNPLDKAVVQAAGKRSASAPLPAKIDEIPYDFLRKRLTVVVRDVETAGADTVITKGALDQVLEVCSQAVSGDRIVELDDVVLNDVRSRYEEWGKQGYRVLGVASRAMASRPRYSRDDEASMVFEGFLLFFDPLKDNIEHDIRSLSDLGIAAKIITGDNRHVAAHVAEAIGLDPARLMTGDTISTTSDEALPVLASSADIFAEIDPQQKERLVDALQRAGHTVAYMGDGINDAPALHKADVGISVDSAVDVARETADIVLLKRDLDVLRQGVVDGRRTFANTVKYIEITTSANFGNMISMALATLFVPFLPLLAKQILLNNFLSDIPSIAISTDNVDGDAVRRPQRWDIRRIRSFMIVFGLVSTVFDLLLFALLLGVFHAHESLFQSAWFVVSLLTELAVVLVLRTHGAFWRSRPSPALLYSTIAIFAASLSLPYIPLMAETFGFEPVPAPMLLTGLSIVALYIWATEFVKRRFFCAREETQKQLAN